MPLKKFILYIYIYIYIYNIKFYYNIKKKYVHMGSSMMYVKVFE